MSVPRTHTLPRMVAIVSSASPATNVTHKRRFLRNASLGLSMTASRLDAHRVWRELIRIHQEQRFVKFVSQEDSQKWVRPLVFPAREDQHVWEGSKDNVPAEPCLLKMDRSVSSASQAMNATQKRGRLRHVRGGNTITVRLNFAWTARSALRLACLAPLFVPSVHKGSTQA
jgi:hypothetical protein